jgi:uncharacterized protein YxjI
MLLNRKTFLVKERAKLAKLTNTYDLLDAESGQTIGVAKEEPSALVKWGRLFAKDMKLPTTINIYESEGSAPVLTLKQGFAFVAPKVEVSVSGRGIGSFQAKALTLAGAFRVFDAQGNESGKVEGDWKGWNFSMTNANGEELGKITKTWAGVGRGLLGADTFVIAVSDNAASRPDLPALLLAAGMSIELVFKKRK